MKRFGGRGGEAGHVDCAPMIHEPFFSPFSFGEIGQRAGCHSKSAQTYSWSRLIIDIYNGDKFHRDFWPWFDEGTSVGVETPHQEGKKKKFRANRPKAGGLFCRGSCIHPLFARELRNTVFSIFLRTTREDRFLRIKIE